MIYIKIVLFFEAVLFSTELLNVIKLVRNSTTATDKNDILPALEQAFALCPFKTMCQGPQDSNILWKDDYPEKREMQEKNFSALLTTSCCKPCSCKTDCSNKLNCCPDVEQEFIFTNGSSFEESSEVIVTCGYLIPSILFAPKGIKFPKLFLKEVSSCRPTENVTATAEMDKCLHPPATFDGHVRVYSLSTDLMYRNKFCAQCNNVNDSTR